MQSISFQKKCIAILAKSLQKSIVAVCIVLMITQFSSCFKGSRNIASRNKKAIHERANFWDSLPQPIGIVSDFEGLFTDKENKTMAKEITAFSKKTDIEIAIVTIDTSATTKDQFDALILHMANTWGVGEAGKDNGILIGISRGFRKIRIANGKGIEKMLSDQETKTIIDEGFIPGYKKEEYYNGTKQGLDMLMRFLENK